MSNFRAGFIFPLFLDARLNGRISVPTENLIVLRIIVGAMAVFMAVAAWLSLDRNKLPHDNHGAAE